MKEIKVLLIEDSTTFAEFVKIVLAEHGAWFNVHHCACLDDALAAANQEHFDVVILDLILPNGAGERLVQEVQERINLPILVLTGAFFEENEVLLWGAQEFMAKDDFVQRHELLAKKVIRAMVRESVRPIYARNMKAINEIEKMLHKLEEMTHSF